VGDLLVHQRLRHHADHMTALGHGRIGHGAHEADGGAAIDQIDSVGGQRSSQRLRRFEIDGVLTGIGAAENAQAHDVSFLIRLPIDERQDGARLKTWTQACAPFARLAE
jgi:hypothetical protein